MNNIKEAYQKNSNDVIDEVIVQTGCAVFVKTMSTIKNKKYFELLEHVCGQIFNKLNDELKW